MKISNEQNLKNYKKRKILWWFIIIFGILTIVLSFLSLLIKLGVGYALIAFIIMTLLTKKRNSIEYISNDNIKKKIKNKSRLIVK